MTEQRSKGRSPKGVDIEDSGNSGDERDVFNTETDHSDSPTPTPRRSRGRRFGGQEDFSDRQGASVDTAGIQDSNLLGKGKLQGPSTTQNLSGVGCSDTTSDGRRNSFQGQSNSAKPAGSSLSGAGSQPKQSFGHGNGTQHSSPPVNLPRQTSTKSDTQDTSGFNSDQMGHTKHGSSGFGTTQRPNSIDVFETQPFAATEKPKSIDDDGEPQQYLNHGGSSPKAQGGNTADIDGSMDRSTLSRNSPNPSGLKPLPTEQTGKDGKKLPVVGNEESSDKRAFEGYHGHTDSYPGKSGRSLPDANADRNAPVDTALIDGAKANPCDGTPSATETALGPGKSGLVPKPPNCDKTSSGKFRRKQLSAQDLLTGSDPVGEEDAPSHTGDTASPSNVKPTGRDQSVNQSEFPASEQGPEGDEDVNMHKGDAASDRGMTSSDVLAQQKLRRKFKNATPLPNKPNLPSDPYKIDHGLLKQNIPGQFVQETKNMFEKETNSGGVTAKPIMQQLPNILPSKERESTQSRDSCEDKKDVVTEDGFVIEPGIPKLEKCDDIGSDSALPDTTQHNTPGHMEHLKGKQSSNAVQKKVDVVTRQFDKPVDNSSSAKHLEAATIQKEQEVDSDYDLLDDFKCEDGDSSSKEIIRESENDIETLCADFKKTMTLKKTNENLSKQQLQQVLQSTELIHNNSNEATENGINQMPSSDCIAKNDNDDNSVVNAPDSASGKHDNDNNKVTESEVQPAIPSGLEMKGNSMAGSHLNTFENTDVATKTDIVPNHEKVVHNLPEDMHNLTRRFKSSQANKENVEQKDEITCNTQPGNFEIACQSGLVNESKSLFNRPDNNCIASESQRSQMDTQESNQDIKTDAGCTNSDQQAKQRISNGKYRIEKQGEYWCLRDINKNKLYPQKGITAATVVFAGPELLSVDGVLFQVISIKGKPTLRNCNDSGSDSSQSDGEQHNTPGHRKGHTTSYAPQEKVSTEYQKESNCDKPALGDANSGKPVQTATAQLEQEGLMTSNGGNAATATPKETSGNSLKFNDDINPPPLPPRDDMNSKLPFNSFVVEQECLKRMVRSDIFRNAFKENFPYAEFEIIQEGNTTLMSFQSGSNKLDDVQKWVSKETTVEKLEFGNLKKTEHIQGLYVLVDKFMRDECNQLGNVFWAINEGKRYINFCVVGETSANTVRGLLTKKLKSITQVTIKCDTNTTSVLPVLKSDLSKAIGICDVHMVNSVLVVTHFQKDTTDSEVIDVVKQILQNNASEICNIQCKKGQLSELTALGSKQGIKVNISKEEDLKCITLIFPNCQMVKLSCGTKLPVGSSIEVCVVDAVSLKDRFELKGDRSVLKISKKQAKDKTHKHYVHDNVEGMFNEVHKLKMRVMNIFIPDIGTEMADLYYLWTSIWIYCNRAFEEKRPLEKVQIYFAGDSAYLECARVFIEGTRPEVWCDNRQSIELGSLEVTILPGNLEETKADVIVNSIGNSLDLHEGYVSNQLLNLAGEDLQNAVFKNGKKKNIKIGELIETESFKLKTCQFIFHGFVGVCQGQGHKRISDKEEERLLQCMKQLVINCIKQTDAKKLSSIAFPALGTGKAKFNVLKVAGTMFQAIKETRESLTYVKKIIIVVDHRTDEQSKVFQKQKDHWLNTLLWDRKSSRILRFEHIVCKAVCISLQQTHGVDKFIYIAKDGGASWPEDAPEQIVGYIASDGSELNMSRYIGKALGKAFTENMNTVGIYVQDELMTNNVGKLFCITAAAMASQCKRTLRVLLLFSEDKWCTETFSPFEQETVKSVKFTAQGPEQDIQAFLHTLTTSKEFQADIDSSMETVQPSVDIDAFNGAKPKHSKAAIAPRELTIQRDHPWNKSMLHAGVETKIAVVDGLQAGTTENKLEQYFIPLLTAHKPQIVFVEGTTKALLVFDKESDMQAVLNNKSEKFSIKPHPPLGLSNCRYVIAKNSVQNNCLMQFLLCKKFQLPYFGYEDINGNVIIMSQTSFGVEYIKSSLKDYDCKTYSCVTELKMKVLGSKKFGSELFGISNIDGEIFCDVTSVTMVCRKRAFEENDKLMNKILKFEGEKEFPLEDDNLAKAAGWCKALESDGYISIVLNEERKLVVIFERYDDVQKVITKFKSLNQKVKPTGRMRNREVAPNTTSMTDKESEIYGNSGASAVSDESWITGANNLVYYSQCLPIKLYVYKASICTLNVDCIVNAANGNLSHGAGVAFAIAKDAGEEFTKEGDAYIQSHGKIPVGEVAVTKAGRMKYKCVIHAVGPRWSDYDTSTPEGVENCGKHLYDAVMNSFMEANRLKMKSIALPAISSAIFGVPMKYCTMKYAKAVLDFCTLTKAANLALTEIHFVDVNLDTVREIQAMFDGMIRDNQPEPLDAIGMLSTSSRRNRSTFESSVKQNAAIVSSTQNKHKVAIKPFKSGKNKQYNGDITLTLHSPELETKIYCYKGNIFEAPVNALVVIVDNQCFAGRIGNTLRERMDFKTKQLYDAQLKAIVPLHAKTGSVIEVKGQWERYNTILNVVLPYEVNKMSANPRKELMNGTYKELYQKVCANPMTKSVAMTPLAVYTSTAEEIRLGAEMFWKGFLDHCGRLKDGQHMNLDIHLVCNDPHNLLKTIEVLEECNTALEKIHSDATTPEENNKSQIFMKVSDEELKQDGNCVICMDKITEAKKLLCGHIFCAACIDQSLGFKPCCPTCGRVCGIIKGNQPAGKMIVTIDSYMHCFGYEKFKKICIKYNFYDGIQLDVHPAPGKPYRGITRTAYLPDNEQGRNVCRMLKVAFQRKLVFTIGHSHTTGQDDAITWNDIHHKTDFRRDTQFGYPDPTYLDRVTEELKAKSITLADIDQNSSIEEVLESN